MISLRQLLFALAAPAAMTAPAARAGAASAADGIEPLLAQYCFRCHGAQTQQGGIDLAAAVAQRPLVRNRETWRRAAQAIEIGMMPPQGLPQPSAAQRGRLLAALDESIEHFDYSGIDNPGFEPLRRLTHTEYDNTIRDLFGVDLRLARRFTSEMTGETGFENSAGTLFLQPALMERYIAAAERLVEEALPDKPSTAAQRRALQTLFAPRLRQGVTEDEAAGRLVRNFLRRAFRRPPTDGEMERARAKYRQDRRAGRSFEQAVKSVVAAALISPNFLFHVESGPPREGAWRIADWELASRLSYFLWASMPDEELFALAARNRLREPETLLRQLQRMLADEKADTLGTVFAAQWLGFGHVGSRVRMGPIDFPWCTDSLMDDMRAESAMFFMSLLRENAPIARLIDADYTFVSRELAEKLYALDGIEGSHMRRITWDDPNRGGILGHAAILAVTSNYNKTSPIKRGHWVLDSLLGTPPPPPPPNAGVFQEAVGKQQDLTFREKLALHSDNESCRSCHARIDPLGFSLENFDYFGQWRDNYTFRIRIKDPEDINVEDASDFKEVVKRVDASGILPEGAAFDGPSGLKKALLEHRHDDLVRQTVTRMLAYALGRSLEYYDEPAVRKIIRALEADGFRFQTLLREIVVSYPFLYKQSPEEETD